MENFDFLKDAKLQGEEVVATYFFPEEATFMLMAIGENVNGEKEGPTAIYLYMFEDGEVSYGVDTFFFLDHDRMFDFINNLSNMSALNYLLRSAAIPPSIK
ncbi:MULTISPECIES: hypothetical protein [unclassified Sporosarcina]|uniref:hypothetical protein n=1 Tax=unclassified Sporosarcina TaxID=2647733 RepID=UPI00203D169E|nr:MULTISPECIES: hypothetical protein [unclassified Sporosarcina]GKV65548.1 hypothetical protein NCCP2331_17010 [Sporosarcina sp. NCCP-2331]GLB55673.1 hypothetical protein NCCP2378_14600 [Sporosarcina sp. NCCP-2378]